MVAWVATGFDVLASRVVARPGAADRPVRRRRRAGAGVCPRWTGAGYVDPGFAMDSAWRGVLPPDTGFVHLDDVPARVVLDLAQRGVALAKEHGSAHGPPASLLDQEVVAVSSGRRRRRHSDAVRIRLDRNGFPAAVADREPGRFAPGVGGRRRGGAGAGAAGVAAHRRPVRHGVPPPRRPGGGPALADYPGGGVRAAARRRPGGAGDQHRRPSGSAHGRGRRR